MSAIKDKIAWYQHLVSNNREKGFIDESLERDLEVTKEISDRLDRLEKLSNERCVHIQEVIDGENCACGSYRPVSVVSQSPMPVEVPPPSTLYTGDTERSCDQPTQEQLWICPKAKDCPCNQHILKKPSCNHVVPHKKSRMCESASSVCPECIPYAQEQGGDDKDYDALLKKYQDLMAWYDNHSGTPCEQIRHEHEVADLRARLSLLEAENAELKRQLDKIKDLCPLTYNKNVVCARLYDAEKENAELKRIFPAICTALVNGACCSESSSVEFLREIPNEVAAVVKKLSEENAELKRQLNSEVKG